MTIRRPPISLFAFAIIAIGFLYLLPNRMLADEHVHWPQALRFSKGDWQVDPWLSTWPTMNFVVSCVLRLFDSEQLWLGRLTIIAFALLAYIGFVRLASAVQSPSPRDGKASAAASELKALQWFVGPLMLLVSTVLYTDVTALCALVWAAVGVVERRRALFLIAGIATVMFRQTHLVWFAALLAWHLALTWRASTSLTEPRVSTKLFAMIRTERWTLLVSATAAVCWASVVATTGGVAFGVNTQPAHHVGVGGVANEFFAMVVWTAAFAPLALGTLLALARDQTTRREAFRSAAVVLVVAVMAALFFEATLPGNTHPSTMVLIRNQALQALNHPLGRVLMVALCVAGAVVWWRTSFAPLMQPFKWPFFAVSALYLLPFSLIEQRYYLPMFMLLAAFRVPLAARWEWAQLGWSIALSALLLYHVVNKGRFL